VGLTPNPINTIAVCQPVSTSNALEPSERPGDEVGCLQISPCPSWVTYQACRFFRLSAEGTYHRVFDVFIPNGLKSAARKDCVAAERCGIKGNMHDLFLIAISQDVIKFQLATLGNKNIK